jgi:hypothetical protein
MFDLRNQQPMLDNVKKVLAGFAVLAALALGGSAIAGATGDGSGSGSAAATEQVAEEENEGREGKKDAAAQATACEAAGVDPSAENIEFDDETGTCTLGAAENDKSEAGDTGSSAENESGEESKEVSEDDGPGGHADESQDPNADHQFEGKE